MTDTIKQAQSIVGTSAGRAANDFYPTPAYVTEALLRVEAFPNPVWEPACGTGAISQVLMDHGYLVASTDLIDYGYSKGGIDFISYMTPLGKSIVTNPPFKLAEKFIIHAVHELGIEKMALLCKLSFLEGAYRSRILEKSPLCRVWVFRKRITMTRNGEPMRSGGMIAFAWFVWERGYQGKPEIGWI